MHRLILAVTILISSLVGVDAAARGVSDTFDRFLSSNGLQHNDPERIAQRFVAHGSPELELSRGIIVWVPRGARPETLFRFRFNSAQQIRDSAHAVPVSAGTRLIVMRAGRHPYQHAGNYRVVLTEYGLWGLLNIDGTPTIREGGLRSIHAAAVAGRTTVILTDDYGQIQVQIGEKSQPVTFTRGETYELDGQEAEKLGTGDPSLSVRVILGGKRRDIARAAGAEVTAVPTEAEIPVRFLHRIDLAETNQAFPLAQNLPQPSGEAYNELVKGFSQLIGNDLDFAKPCLTKWSQTKVGFSEAGGSLTLGSGPLLDWLTRILGVQASAQVAARLVQTVTMETSLQEKIGIYPKVWVLVAAGSTNMLTVQVRMQCDNAGNPISRFIWYSIEGSVPSTFNQQSGQGFEFSSAHNRVIFRCFTGFLNFVEPLQRDGVQPAMIAAVVLAAGLVARPEEFLRNHRSTCGLS